ncbi:hypothetical protein [Methylogaea oryzae]|uniref:hypothetical protein n=1 Tax=Methylogaea oryzae TaxID=1295382 RepID=UPI0030D8342B
MDTVVITHLHADHVGGLNDADGRPLFGNAKIFVSQADSDFWLSQQVADNAPAEVQPFFKMRATTPRLMWPAGSGPRSRPVANWCRA